MRIDLNSDLGEGFGPWAMGDDAGMLKLVTSANVACGFHAGDPQIMRRTVVMARELGVAVGAHPGYQDLSGFGRRPVAGLTLHEIENLVAYQIGALAAICALEGHPMAHVKTHGALGNACAEDDAMADAVARAIRAAAPQAAFMTMPGSATDRAADRAGLPQIREIYADRTYGDDFNLSPRSQPGAVIHDPAVALVRAMEMVAEGRIETVSGKALRVEIDSICVHGDTPAAVAMTRMLREGLEAAGWQVAAPQISPSTAPPSRR